jgi:murein DD-endopeptidase MepM/ murein hydrolase activator NlpD
VGGLAAAVLALTAVPALAAVPSPPPSPTDKELGDAAAAQQAAAAEVGRIAGLVTQAESDLERLEVQAEATGAALDAADQALRTAQADADRATDALNAAAAAVTDAQERLSSFSRSTYMDKGTLSTPAALLDSAGPGDLVQRAATLDWVAANQVDVLAELQAAQAQQSAAEATARSARDARAAAEKTAAAAKAAADAQLAGGKNSYDQATEQKAVLDKQLQDAQVHLLELQGARNAYQQWLAQKQAEEAAARQAQSRAAQKVAADAAAARAKGAGGVVLPAAGRTSSCFGSRWGVHHLGVDIAASIGTPIYAATSGVVERSGAATGFGLAVYLRGTDGAVTVYGHVNRSFVKAGDRVTVGQQIAEVGNRGQSTGPHLHFEVHPNGELYDGAVNPAPWLRAHDVAFSGC